jgi:hypothetical protein
MTRFSLPIIRFTASSAAPAGTSRSRTRGAAARSPRARAFGSTRMRGRQEGRGQAAQRSAEHHRLRHVQAGPHATGRDEYDTFASQSASGRFLSNAGWAGPSPERARPGRGAGQAPPCRWCLDAAPGGAAAAGDVEVPDAAPSPAGLGVRARQARPHLLDEHGFMPATASPARRCASSQPAEIRIALRLHRLLQRVEMQVEAVGLRAHPPRPAPRPVIPNPWFSCTAPRLAQQEARGGRELTQVEAGPRRGWVNITRCEPTAMATPSASAASASRRLIRCAPWRGRRRSCRRSAAGTISRLPRNVVPRDRPRAGSSSGSARCVRRTSSK